MMHLMLAGLAMLLATVSFHYAHCLSGINNAYLGLYKGVVEEAVVVADEDGEYRRMPVFYLPRLRTLLTEYFSVNLTPYCRRYVVTVTGQLGEHFHSYVSYTAHVIIDLEAKIDDIHTLRKIAQFDIVRSES